MMKWLLVAILTFVSCFPYASSSLRGFEIPSDPQRQSLSSNSEQWDNLNHRLTTLTSRSMIPTLGIDISVSDPLDIPFILSSSLEPSQNVSVRLIDIGNSFGDQHILLGRSLKRLAKTSAFAAKNSTTVFHVVASIWHTHLGYERTMYRLQEIVEQIRPVGSDDRQPWAESSHIETIDVRAHIILQRTRCLGSHETNKDPYKNFHRHEIASDCQTEEEALGDPIKDSGPNPLLEPQNAWKGSWRAMEELHHQGIVESIGISSEFSDDDLRELYDFSMIGPHIYQGGLVDVLLKPDLMNDLRSRNVHFQALGVPQIMSRLHVEAPDTIEELGMIGSWLSQGYSSVQLITSWLTEIGVSVISAPVYENGRSISSNYLSNIINVPADLAKFHSAEIRNLLKSFFLSDNFQAFDADPKKKNLLEGTFVAKTDRYFVQFINDTDRAIKIFVIDSTTGTQLPLTKTVTQGNGARIQLREEQERFVAYDLYGNPLKSFVLPSEPDDNITFIVKVDGR